jgi:transcriptional regulator with PAS, ATPase and Fis domain
MICDRPNKKYRPFRNRISYNTAINQDLKRLEAHDWPGNVREPENVIMGIFFVRKSIPL